MNHPRSLLTDDEWATLQHDPIRLLQDGRSEIRRLAIAGCGDRLARGESAEIRAALETTLAAADPAERAAAAEALGACGAASLPALLAAADDPEPAVVEAIATACGEIESPEAVSWLIETARSGAQTLVREAAVAALGAIGDERALPVLLDLLVDGPPQVRRRSVVALTVFDDARIPAALRRATSDRNPMVREVAEMVSGPEPEATG